MLNVYKNFKILCQYEQYIKEGFIRNTHKGSDTMKKYFDDILDIRYLDIDSYLIKKIEKYIRSSIEYRKWCLYIRDEKNLNTCEYFKDVWDNIEDGELTTEVHHNIFTLYDIVETVAYKLQKEYTDNKKVLLPIDISREVINLHLDDKVSCIVLSKTIHEAYHSGLYKYKQKNCTGNWESFAKEYIEYIPEHTREKILNTCNINLVEKYGKKENNSNRSL